MTKTGRTTTFLVLPGYGGSGPEHWQSLWQDGNPAFKRVEQEDWEHPNREAWVRRLEETLDRAQAPVVLVAHSLACLLVPHWAAGAKAEQLAKVRGALLVAVADPEGGAFPKDAKGFSPVPMEPLPFNTLVVASSDDPYATPDFSRACSEAWGAEWIEVGAKGHINADSGLGRWNEGRELLDFLA